MISRINCISPGYSFAKFKGPVSGPERKVVYNDGDPYSSDHIDYVAKPDYHFAYGVQDPKSKNHQSRQETRHGDTVHGEYRSVRYWPMAYCMINCCLLMVFVLCVNSVLDPDGRVRTVQYTADKAHGFQAKVITDGHVIHHPQQGPTVYVHDDDDDQVYRHPAAQPHQPPAPPKSHEHPNTSNDADDDMADEEYDSESENSDDGDYEGDGEEESEENGDDEYY